MAKLYVVIQYLEGGVVQRIHMHVHVVAIVVVTCTCSSYSRSDMYTVMPQYISTECVHCNKSVL